MAAIDLERGGRGWGQERAELGDSFDSEMQEWEDQLQDIQRKIEELYNEVQARRGTHEPTAADQKDGGESACGLGRHDNGILAPDHHSRSQPGAATHRSHHHNGYGVSEIGDLLQDYLVQGKEMSRRNNGARHVHFNDKVKVSHDVPAHEDKTRRAPGNDRFGQDKLMGPSEETENRKNRASHARSCPNKENSGGKPPVGQREAAVVAQPRPQLPAAESPAQDRKTYTPGLVGEKKCSPYVLRKFGAMLQENEGKMLTESGVVAPQGQISELKCSTPGCQRRAAGAAAVASRAPMRVPPQKCQTDSDVLTAPIEPGQEWGIPPDSVRLTHKDHRGGYSGSKGAQPSPQPSRRRSQVAGSPKAPPRSNGGADRNGGRRSGYEHVEPKMEHRVSSSSGHRGGFAPQGLPGCGQVTDEGLIELLDMLDIQHEYGPSSRAGPTAHRQQPQQVNSAELSPVTPKRSFSRPARPANQRPPSRWASRTPTARILAPTGPMRRPPSPMTRHSPSLKQRPLVSYCLQTETVIM